MPLNADDPFLPHLRAVVDRNFLDTELQQDPSEPISHPIAFHDRHIAAQLTLERVRIIPGLAEDLADFYSQILDEFVRNGHKFNGDKYISYSRPKTMVPMKEAYFVAFGYNDIFGVACSHLASKVLFTPGSLEWPDLLLFIPADSNARHGKDFFVDGRLIVDSMEPALQSSPPASPDALALHDVYQWLGSWCFFPLVKRGHKIISMMSSMSRFQWETPHTSGLPSPARLPVPPDAPHGFVTEQITRYLSTRRREPNAQDARRPSSKKQSIKIPRRRMPHNYVAISKDYIQKAWSTAVEEDTTFLTFNCGSRERIGIRHRGSQTLYLSGPIDTAHTSPTYGKIQLGLYFAIVRDALNRMDARKEFDKVHKTSLKRPAVDLDIDEDMPRAKRPRTDADPPVMRLANSTGTISDAEREMSKRSALLINLRYGIYDSPSPSCFIRLGASCVEGLFDDKFEVPAQRITYEASDYMTATLRAPIGKGAVGTAHRGNLELSTRSAKSLSRPCLIKLAFAEEARTALEHEFVIYQHLAQKNVYTGVPRVHGLFRDTQTDTLALLMDYGGYSLRRREYELDNEFRQKYVDVEEHERATIFQALKQIHNAGVCHNDVRIDNIVVNHANEVAIIDFDQATFSSRPFDYEEEIKELEYVVRCAETSESDTSTDEESVSET